VATPAFVTWGGHGGPPLQFFHSLLKATKGSTLVARRAGTSDANSGSGTTIAETPAASRGFEQQSECL